MNPPDLQAQGIGYTRLEQCMVDLVRAIHLLVEQNALLLQAIAEKEEEEHEPIGYLSLKKR